MSVQPFSTVPVPAPAPGSGYGGKGWQVGHELYSGPSRGSLVYLTGLLLPQLWGRSGGGSAP